MTHAAPPFFAENPTDIPEKGFLTDGDYVFEKHGDRAYLHNPNRKADPDTQGNMVHFSIHPKDVNWAWQLISRIVAESDIAIGSVVLDGKVKKRFGKARDVFADKSARKTITLKDDQKYLQDWIAILKKIETVLASEKIRPGHAVDDSTPLNGSQYAYQNPLNDIDTDAIDVSDVYDAPEIEALDIPEEFSLFDTLEEMFSENVDTLDTEIIELEAETVFDADDEINHLHEVDPTYDALPEFEELELAQLEDMLALPLHMVENPETGEVHMEMDISDPELFAPDEVHDARAAMKYFNIGSAIKTDAKDASAKLIVSGDGMDAFFSVQKRYVQLMAHKGHIEMGQSINGTPVHDADGNRMPNIAHIHFDPLLGKDDPYARPPKQAWALSQSLYRLDRHNQWKNDKPIEPVTLETRPWQVTGYASRPWTKNGIDTSPQNSVGIVTGAGLMEALNETLFNRSAAPAAQVAPSVPMHRPAA